MAGTEPHRRGLSTSNLNDDDLKKLEQTIRAARKPEAEFNEIYSKAMDDAVNVNSLFMIAVFLGLSIASPEYKGLDQRCKLHNITDVGKKLIMREVLAFACFLFSSLMAKSLKVYLNIKTDIKTDKEKLGFRVRRGVAYSLSVLATVAGVVILTVSMADVVRIKVGRLLCGTHHALTTVVLLAIIVGFGVAAYLWSMLYTLIHCTVKSEADGQIKKSSASN